MNEVGCYVAFPEVRDAILALTVLILFAIVYLARFVERRRERRATVAAPAPAMKSRRARVVRPIVTFTIFYRTAIGEGGFACPLCTVFRHDNFPRVSNVFAVATHHLNLCRAAVGPPVEGHAIIDGVTHSAELREGIMIVALDPVFISAPPTGARRRLTTDLGVPRRRADVRAVM